MTTDHDHNRPYTDAMSDWIETLMTSDATGRWYPFILNDIVIPHEIRVTHQHDLYRRRALVRACEYATAHITQRATANPTRQHPDDAVRCIVLPARVQHRTHLHGWCRVPHSDGEMLPLSYKQNRYTMRVTRAPRAVVLFSENLCDRLATRNIWWNLNEIGGSLHYARRVLSREHRDWMSLELQPAYLFNPPTKQVA